MSSSVFLSELSVKLCSPPRVIAAAFEIDANETKDRAPPFHFRGYSIFTDARPIFDFAIQSSDGANGKNLTGFDERLLVVPRILQRIIQRLSNCKADAWGPAASLLPVFYSAIYKSLIGNGNVRRLGTHLRIGRVQEAKARSPFPGKCPMRSCR